MFIPIETNGPTAAAAADGRSRLHVLAFATSGLQTPLVPLAARGRPGSAPPVQPQRPSPGVTTHESTRGQVTFSNDLHVAGLATAPRVYTIILNVGNSLETTQSDGAALLSIFFPFFFCRHFSVGLCLSRGHCGCFWSRAVSLGGPGGAGSVTPMVCGVVYYPRRDVGFLPSENLCDVDRRRMLRFVSCTGQRVPVELRFI